LFDKAEVQTILQIIVEKSMVLGGDLKPLAKAFIKTNRRAERQPLHRDSDEEGDIWGSLTALSTDGRLLIIVNEAGFLEAVHIPQGSTLLFLLNQTVHAGVEGRKGVNCAIHLAHTLPVSEGEVYTVTGEDGTLFENKHGNALAAITRESRLGLLGC
jgi:hypothetical protein